MAPYSAPFSKEQKIWIIQKYNKLGSIASVRRQFRNEFLKDSPLKVPKDPAFFRVVRKFNKSGSVTPGKSTGKPATKVTEENSVRVMDKIKEDNSQSIRQIVRELNLSFTTVWRIMRKKLQLFPYKAKSVVPLTAEHKAARVRFCQWLLEQDVDFCQSVIWSAEKMWEEKTRPNKQNERYWGLEDPEVQDENRVVGGTRPGSCLSPTCV